MEELFNELSEKFGLMTQKQILETLCNYFDSNVIKGYLEFLDEEGY